MRASSQWPSVPQKKRNPSGCALLLFVIRLGFGKVTYFSAEYGALLGVVMLYKTLIIKYISYFSLNVSPVNLRNPFERILIDVVQMLSKF